MTLTDNTCESAEPEDLDPEADLGGESSRPPLVIYRPCPRRTASKVTQPQVMLKVRGRRHPCPICECAAFTMIAEGELRCNGCRALFTFEQRDVVKVIEPTFQYPADAGFSAASQN